MSRTVANYGTIILFSTISIILFLTFNNESEFQITVLVSFVPDHQRFDEPSFSTYAKMESLLVKALHSQDNFTELRFMEKKNYTDDINIRMLNAKLEIATEGMILFMF